MKYIRKADQRGTTNFGWLNSRHSFSFGEYYDPEMMGYRSLRVINDDTIAGGGGFPMHPHRDMEILTWVLEGALEHKDSLGNGSIIHPNELQRMTAGTGIRHSEFNHSPTETVRLLQIWILPEARGLTPSYEQKSFNPHDRLGKLHLIASRNGENGSISLKQDVKLYASTVRPEDKINFSLGNNRGVWIQVATGSVKVSGEILSQGDAIAIESVPSLVIEGHNKGGEILLFDLA